MSNINLDESTEYGDLLENYIKESNRYEMGEILGEGSYGKVYKAIDRTSGETVAIKIIEKMSKPLPEEPEYIYYRQILKETADKLNKTINSIDMPICHRNIVCYYKVFEEDGKVYVVMEYVEGSDLFDYIQAHANFGSDVPINKIVDILKQITKGLIHLHSVGVIHRDIKPENILIDKDGNIKITDYGLSCFKDIYRSCSGQVGTPAYVSPQILDNDLMDNADDRLLKEIYKSNDVWSMGVVAYMLANQAMPFNGEYDEGSQDYDMKGATLSILNDEPLSEYRGGSSSIYNDMWLNEIIENILTKNYINRPTLKEIELDLEIDRLYYYKNMPYDRMDWIKMLNGLGYEVDETLRTEELMEFMDKELFCRINNKLLTSSELLYISKIMGIKYNMLTMGATCQQLRELYKLRYKDFKNIVDQNIIMFLKTASANELEDYIINLSILDPSLINLSRFGEYMRIVSNSNVNDAYDKYSKLEVLKVLFTV